MPAAAVIPSESDIPARCAGGCVNAAARIHSKIAAVQPVPASVENPAFDQYNEMIEVQGKPLREQYNYTLTLNGFLDLIVLSKERALSFRRADR